MYRITERVDWSEMGCGAVGWDGMDMDKLVEVREEEGVHIHTATELSFPFHAER